MAEGIPIVPTIQTLKYHIDIPSPHNPSGLPDLVSLTYTLQPYDQLIDANTWQEALFYAWERVDPIEAELKVYCSRLIEIGALIGKDTALVVAFERDLPSKKPREAEGWHVVVRPEHGPMLRGMVVQTILLRISREFMRGIMAEALGAQLWEGREMGLLD